MSSRKSLKCRTVTQIVIDCFQLDMLLSNTVKYDLIRDISDNLNQYQGSDDAIRLATIGDDQILVELVGPRYVDRVFGQSHFMNKLMTLLITLRAADFGIGSYTAEEILLLLLLLFQLVYFQIHLSVLGSIGWWVWHRYCWEATACDWHVDFLHRFLTREIYCLYRYEECCWHCSLLMSVMLPVLPFLLLMILWKLIVLLWWYWRLPGLCVAIAAMPPSFERPVA